MNNIVAHVPEPCEGREQPRTHLFVSATLDADGKTTPVRIRNMSPSGALIEAEELPDVGCSIMLNRGPLHATGYVAWRVEGRAGVRFEAPVCVPEWTSRQVSVGRARVEPVPASANSGTAIEAELATLRSDLAALGRSLIADTKVAATHPEIHSIGFALQRIDRIALKLRQGA